MTSEMGEMFNEIRAHRKEKKAKRRDEFSANADGWTRHSETHYSRILLGDRLDYWPGTLRFRWRGRTMNGDVFGFIRKRAAAAPKGDG